MTDIKTKDDIIFELKCNSDGYQTTYPYGEVEKAMDEYAKQECINFLQFCLDTNRLNSDFGGNIFINTSFGTKDDFHNDYLQSKQK